MGWGVCEACRLGGGGGQTPTPQQTAHSYCLYSYMWGGGSRGGGAAGPEGEVHAGWCGVVTRCDVHTHVGVVCGVLGAAAD